MAYTVGDTILAAHFNDLLGDKLATVAYTDVSDATGRANAIYGVGYRDYGYGQIASPFINQGPVAIGDTVTGSHWANLVAIMDSLSVHQGTPVTLPPASVMDPTDIIYALDDTNITRPTDAQYDITNTTGALSSVNADTNRFETANHNLTVAPFIVNNAGVGSWSNFSNVLVEVAWNDVSQSQLGGDKIRWFFNSGGQIGFRHRFINPVTPQDTYWSNLYENIGTVWYGGKEGGGVASVPAVGTFTKDTDRGYWDLESDITDSSRSRVWDSGTANGGGTIYNQALLNQVLIQAYSSTNDQGQNGGFGRNILFFVESLDRYVSSDPFFGIDQVSATATSYYQLEVSWRMSDHYNPPAGQVYAPDFIGVAAGFVTS